VKIMSDDQDQQVRVRLLPDGDAHFALFRNLTGQTLRVDLPSIPAGVRLDAGDLVEVTCTKTLYLGEVRSREGATMIIGVEHALDRETLALIQQVWHGPAAQ
jgi:hypothetical protein